MTTTYSPREFLKRYRVLVRLSIRVKWRVHLLKDWWGTKVWTRTSEVTTPLGFKLTSGYHPAYALMRRGQFEVAETAIISRLLDDVDHFIDIGANLGYYTCLALTKRKPVIAFEPQQQNLHSLFRNLIANGWESEAEVLPVALSSRPGLMTLYGASGPSASLIKGWAGYSSRYSKIVPVSTLDLVLEGRLLDRRLFIKIDVEGAEYEVLLGAVHTIARQLKPVWLLEVCLAEFHPGGSNQHYLQIFDLFFSNGYKAYLATQPPRVVTPQDVAQWASRNRTESETFNYIFSDKEMSMDQFVV